MPTNSGRVVPASQIPQRENPAVINAIQKTNDYNQRVRNAQSTSWNMDPNNLVDGKVADVQHTTLITTPGGNKLTGVFINDEDRNKRVIEFTDIKRGGSFRVPYNEDNLSAFKELANKEATGKYGREWFEFAKGGPKINLWDGNREVDIDEFINSKKEELQKKFDRYLRVFKSYQSAPEKTRKFIEPLMKRALADYNELKNNLYN